MLTLHQEHKIGGQDMHAIHVARYVHNTCCTKVARYVKIQKDNLNSQDILARHPHKTFSMICSQDMHTRQQAVSGSQDRCTRYDYNTLCTI